MSPTGPGVDDDPGAALVSSPGESPGRPCARAGCTQPIVRNAVGRPRIYRSPACRSQAHRDTHPDARSPRHVDVDHGSTSARGRPAGQVWLVRLRRGQQQVIVAAGIGRPSADHLAAQLNRVIHPQPLVNPGPLR